MKVGALLGWRPSEILNATIPELYLSVDGWRLSKGEKPRPRPMARKRMLELAEKYK